MSADDPWTTQNWALDRLAENPATRAETVEFETRLAAAHAGLNVELVPSGRGVAGAAASTERLLVMLRKATARADPSRPRPKARRSPRNGRAAELYARAPPASVSPRDVDAAIATAGSLSGIDPAYLWRTAYVESGLRRNAAASTSSASGLFQFVSGTWLDALRRFGPSLGLGNAASMIRLDAQGHPTVDDPATRVAILALRDDDRIAAAVAAMMTRENAARLSQRFGTAAPAGVLYIAHVLGPEGAASLVRAANLAPGAPAAALFPAAAAANRGLFFRGGRALSALEVARSLAARARS